jgi:hypothetical protein
VDRIEEVVGRTTGAGRGVKGRGALQVGVAKVDGGCAGGPAGREALSREGTCNVNCPMCLDGCLLGCEGTSSLDEFPDEDSWLPGLH